MFVFEIDNEIALKLLERYDATRLIALIDRQRAYLREFLPWVDEMQFEQDYIPLIEQWIDQFRANAGFQSGILYRGEIVGMIGFHPYDWHNRKASIGYWLSEDCQGRGIVTRSCRAMIEYAFETVGLNRIEIRMASENKKSRAIPERLGFVYEGRERDAEWLYDHFVDHDIYGLLKADWREAGSSAVNKVFGQSSDE